MQVVLGSRGDYCVRTVLYLARHPGRQRRQDISRAMDIPDKYLPQILAPLVRAGIARSTAGRLGGYELARPAEAVSLREVVEVAEGPIRSNKCLLRGGPCYWGDKCAMHDAWSAAEAALTERLAATTFAELALADWEIAQRSQSRQPDKTYVLAPIAPPRSSLERKSTAAENVGSVRVATRPSARQSGPRDVVAIDRDDGLVAVAKAAGGAGVADGAPSAGHGSQPDSGGHTDGAAAGEAGGD